MNYHKDKENMASHESAMNTLKSSLKWHGIKPWCSSPGLPSLACTHAYSKCITGKRAMSRTACSPQSSPHSCFYPCHNNGLPVSHLPPTLQIQTGAVGRFQSPLTGAQTVILESKGQPPWTYILMIHIDGNQHSSCPMDILTNLLPYRHTNGCTHALTHILTDIPQDIPMDIQMYKNA